MDAARGGDAGEDVAAIGDALEGLGAALADLDTTPAASAPSSEGLHGGRADERTGSRTPPWQVDVLSTVCGWRAAAWYLRH